MEPIRCTVRFVTPAFLGGADQSAQWRTPPFKALLRQWWRLVWVAQQAGEKGPDPVGLRRAEADLFGAAADERDSVGSKASRVRMRMDWRRGNIVLPERWAVSTGKVNHHEVERAGKKVDAALYLGYGPLDFDKQKGNRLNRPSALPAGEARELTVRVPSDEVGPIKTALCLAHAFGGLGSRSRNGWGSLHFEQGGLTAEELDEFLDPENRKARDWLRAFSRPWRDALKSDWCHALGRDDQGLLIWRTEVMDRWEDVMRRLAEVKIAFRTKLSAVAPHPFSERHILAYPVTNHGLPGGKDKRLANQILFKVLPLKEGQNGPRYVGVIVHLPHGVPAALWAAANRDQRHRLRAVEEKAWSTVHRAVADPRHHLSRLA